MIPPIRRTWIKGVLSNWIQPAAMAGILVFAVMRGAENINYRWQWYRVDDFLFTSENGAWSAGPLIQGLFVTLEISVLSLVLTLVIGLAAAMLRLSSSVIGRGLARGYLELIRNTPLLIQLYVMYFVLGPILGWGQITTAIACLAAFQGAYTSEIFRAGLRAIPRGQVEAGESLGLSRIDNYRHVILPQVLRHMLPPLTNEAVSLVKNSLHRQRHRHLRPDHAGTQPHRGYLPDLRDLAYGRRDLPCRDPGAVDRGGHGRTAKGGRVMPTTGRDRRDSRRDDGRDRTRESERGTRRDRRAGRDGRTRAGSRRFRPTRLDGILLIVLVAAAGWLWYRSAIGVAYRWDWAQALSTVFASGEAGDTPFFLTGIYATLRLSAWGAVLATILGVLIGVGRYSGVRALRMFCGTYIQILRNIPPLVFIFIFYFFISSQLMPLLGLDALFNRPAEDASAWQRFLFGPPALWENLVSGVLCISFISAAYIAEVVRAGLAAIPRGQWEAGGKAWAYRSWTATGSSSSPRRWRASRRR